MTLAAFALIWLVVRLVSAWLTAAVAKSAGSPRGHFTVGLIAALVIFLADVAMEIFLFAIEPSVQSPGVRYGITAILLVAQFVVPFFILKQAFQLRAGRAFAPFGVYVGIVVAQFIGSLTLLKPFVLEAFVLPTASMTPTISPNDRFVVSKVLKPRRLDLVAFYHTDRGRSAYVKRLIGMPGESICFDDGSLLINGVPLALPPALVGHLHATPVGGTRLYYESQTFTLGPDEYFLVGDNAEKSNDSRTWGPTRRGDIIGVVDLIYWPLPKFHVVR